MTYNLKTQFSFYKVFGNYKWRHLLHCVKRNRGNCAVFAMDRNTNCTRRSRSEQVVLYEICYLPVYLKLFFSITFTYRHCRTIEFLHESHTHPHIHDAAVVVKSSSFFPNRKSFGYDFRLFSFVVYSPSLKECSEEKIRFLSKIVENFCRFVRLTISQSVPASLRYSAALFPGTRGQPRPCFPEIWDVISIGCRMGATKWK